MHSDGSGEFINKNLDKFLKGKGVKQTVSTPHTSKHNGVAEDVNVNHLYCMVLIDSFNNFGVRQYSMHVLYTVAHLQKWWIV
jgi:hypothetical protein